jgi:hypothetical protein
MLSALVMHAEVVATVSSSEPFTLRGNVVPIQGVSQWPVFNGDEIATSSASAIVSFSDGSRILMDRNTRLTVALKGKKTDVKVTKGKIWYDLKAMARFSVGTVQRAVAPGTSQASGSLTVTDSGEASVSNDDSILKQLQIQALLLPRATQVPNIYPVSIQYGTTPAGVTTVPGPAPTSSSSPAP